MWDRMKDAARSAGDRSRKAITTSSESFAQKALVFSTLRHLRRAPGRAAQRFQSTWKGLSDEQRAAVKNMVEAMLRTAMETRERTRPPGAPAPDARGTDPEADVEGLDAIGRLIADSPGIEADPDPEPRGDENQPNDRAEELYEALKVLASLGTGVDAEAALATMAQKLSDQERAAGTLTRARQQELQRIIVDAESMARIQDPVARAQRLRKRCSDFSGLDATETPTVSVAGPADAPLDDDEAKALATVDQILESLEEQLASGKLPAAQESRIRSALAESAAIYDLPRRTAAESAVFRSRMGQLLERNQEAVASGGGRFSGEPSSRRDQLGPYAGDLLALVIDERVAVARVGVGKASGDAGVLEALGLRILNLDKALDAAADDEAAYGLERADMRQIAADARLFQRRRHLTIANPPWSSTSVHPEMSAVAYAGGPQLQKHLRAATSRRAMKIRVAGSGRDPAQDAWDRLRSSAVGVFDLTEYGRIEEHGDLERAGRVAGVCHQLGIAFCLGLPVVTVAQAGQEMPFDLDIEPVRLDGIGDEAALAQALDDAFYGRQRAGSGDSVRTTMENFFQRVRPFPSELAEMAESMFDAADTDPTLARLLLTDVLRRLPDPAPEILFPVLPGGYPEQDRRRCFLVTAFRPHLERTTELVEHACRSRGIEFERGDQVLDPGILRAIWDGICGATHVVVDLTDLNPNVAVELGMAQTLGRRVLIISGHQTAGTLPPTLAKVRVHYYAFDREPGTAGVESALAEFLQ